MSKYFLDLESKIYRFNETAFSALMRNRITKVLLICSHYDAFLIEEDGRIDEQIFNEYVSLNLRYPPQFVLASSAEQSLEILEKEQIDLVIFMLSIEDHDPFEFSKKIKTQSPDVPIVILTPFSRELNEKLGARDLSAIDYVFCWLGNADILLAIVKLIEDQMNAQQDIHEIGVQAILLVEDSARFYSSYLPNLYRIIFTQSKAFMVEGLNAHQQMMRMRGRPKVLLATNYEEAISLYQEYKNDLLGVITDISYEHHGRLKKTAGLELCRHIRKDNPFLPFILQSSDSEYAQTADELDAAFIDKNSPTLSKELREYVVSYFAFGDFIFRDPETLEEISRASNLAELQDQAYQISDDSLTYHIRGNHLSHWLNARGLFSIAAMFKDLRPEHFEDIDEVRTFIEDAISSYRLSKSRGIIADFNFSNYDEFSMFTRIGSGSIGGKARGLAFIDSIIKQNDLRNKYEGIEITIPRTIVLSTDIFDEFMEMNSLHQIAKSDIDDEEMLAHFVAARLPGHITRKLLAIINVIRRPIAIRSSSLLEDSHYQPFAGVYSTYMIPNIENDKKLVLKNLKTAIKSVYASVYFKSSKSYIKATANMIDEEKMSIVLQEVIGSKHGDLFFPAISGVGRSYNYYPIEPEIPQDGIANIGIGLGKYVVEGGTNIRFSPKYPSKIVQLSSPELAMRDSQKWMFGLDLHTDSFHASTDDGVNIVRQKTKLAAKEAAFHGIFSTYDHQSHMLRDGYKGSGIPVATFWSALKYESFPLGPILSELLRIGQQEMNKAVEIEFAADIDPETRKVKQFNLLQIRPIVASLDKEIHIIRDWHPEEVLVYSGKALGNGKLENLKDIVYVDPSQFDPAFTQQYAREIEKINDLLIEEGHQCILIAPGRWGSSDPWLGIPVKWGQISSARVMVESSIKGFHIDPSQGTHFFQNLTSFEVGYFTINPYADDGLYDYKFLNRKRAFKEAGHVRHIRFEEPLEVLINGHDGEGIIFKPRNQNY